MIKKINGGEKYKISPTSSINLVGKVAKKLVGKNNQYFFFVYNFVRYFNFFSIEFLLTKEKINFLQKKKKRK